MNAGLLILAIVLQPACLARVQPNMLTSSFPVTPINTSASSKEASSNRSLGEAAFPWKTCTSRVCARFTAAGLESTKVTSCPR